MSKEEEDGGNLPVLITLPPYIAILVWKNELHLTWSQPYRTTGMKQKRGQPWALSEESNETSNNRKTIKHAKLKYSLRFVLSHYTISRDCLFFKNKKQQPQ